MTKVLCVLFWAQTAYLSRVLGAPRQSYSLQDVHSLCQSLHRPSQYFYTGGYTSLEEIKLQEGVKEFYTVPEYYCFHVEFDGGLDFLRCG